MKAQGVIWPALGTVDIEEFEVADPGPGQVRIETEWSQVSPGTEHSWLMGIDPIPPMFKAPDGSDFPQRPGYSIAGRVAAVGPDANGFREGDPVVAIARHATQATLDADEVIRVPERVDLESAAFFHLVFGALDCVRRARIELGEPVAVMGLGVVGLLSLQAARLQGGLPVVALDLVESRLELARRCGADLTVDVRDSDALEALADSLEGGPAVVIEATAALAPIRTALQLVRQQGRVVLVTSRFGEISLNVLGGIHLKGTEVIGAHTLARPRHDSRPGSWTWRDDAATFLNLLRYGRLDVKPLITHRVPGEKAASLYELVKTADPSLIGGLLHWR